MILRTTLTNILLILTLLALSACTLPGGESSPTQVSVEAIYTAAAQTLESKLTQTSAAQPTAIPTNTPEPATPAPADTSTPDFTPTASSTPEPTVPMVTIQIGSNCRKGPGTAYEPPIITLAEGQKAEIYGRNSNSSWWYVQIPGRSGQYCWVFGDNVNVQGDVTSVQVIAPPPIPVTATSTPKPDVRFDPSFNNIHDCGGEPYAIFEVDNIGDEDFESMSLKIEDTDDEEEIYSASSDNPFLSAASECPEGDDTLKDGDTAWIGGDVDNGETGNDGEATITLCTEEGLKGICVSENVEFILP
ncbi:MAG: hypothetical protein A2Z16_06840 [Chloroflexi bacterium RBG_16_54_18]|nr:MAG: hypothetical protein A2Z16_06840 [Chloroflexi bacterium RBG_16_54_18]